MASLTLRIESDERYTLFDLLNIPLNRFPLPRSKNNASSTTDGAIKNLNIQDGGTLKGVVLVPDLLASSIDEASTIAKKFALVNESDQHALYASSIHAKYTQAWNTPEMNSEQDTREWANVCYVRAALAAMHAVTDPSNAQRTDDIDIDIQKYSYVSSGFSMKREDRQTAGPIMDSFMANGPWVSGAKPMMCMTVEYKSNNALEEDTFYKVTSTKNLEIEENSLIPFYWPEENDVAVEKDAKILCQVYHQMDHSIVQYSWLSSFTTNVFFYKEVGGRELYMSKTYDLASTTPLVIFSWFCRASGLLESAMTVPAPNYLYYNRVKEIVPKTLFNHGIMTFSRDVVKEMMAPIPVGSRTWKRLLGADEESDEEDIDTTPKARKTTAKPRKRAKKQ